jgi:GDP-4-dehydro-6-deoxy-D-mannose reductase
MRSALVTGCGGFCARHLVARLVADDDFKVIGAGSRPASASDYGVHEYHQVDVREPAQVHNLLRTTVPDEVFHLAGLFSGAASDLFRVNHQGTVNVLEAVRTWARCARVLLVGSAAEYGLVDPSCLPVTEAAPCQPLTPYGASKLAATRAGLDATHASGLMVVVARPFNVIGRGTPRALVVGAVIERMCTALRPGGEGIVKAGCLDSIRDFIDVEDVVDGYLKLIRADHWGEIFHICSGRGQSIRSVVSILLSFAPHPLRLQVDPELARHSGPQVVIGSGEKAKELIAFVPTKPLEQSLREAWDYAIAGGAGVEPI